MKAFVRQYIFHLKRWTYSDWLWRLAILSLPWQTRLFFEGPSLAGYPWEQGRISVYASMCLMLTYSLFVVFKKHKRSLIKLRPEMFIGFLLLLVVSLLTMNTRATFMWILQVIVIVVFFMSLARDYLVRKDTLITWFCLSMIPHALLGIAQFLDQRVIASTFLGIAEQLPKTLGVSVIETGGERVLRAYGGFPHPNIFGGWLAFSTAGALFCGLKKKGVSFYTWMIGVMLFTTALFLSFSRSAWLAAIWLVGIIAGGLFFKGGNAELKHRVVQAISAMVICTALLGIWQSPLLTTRTHIGARLEAKSFEERGFAMQLAEKTIAKHWLVGTGEGAYLYALVTTHIWDASYPGPPIPPHNAFVLLFAELGALGTAGLLLLGIGIMKQITKRRDWMHGRSLIFFVPIGLLGIFDYYLWSFWSGQILCAIVIMGWALTLDKHE